MPPHKPMKLDSGELRAQAAKLNTVGEDLQTKLANAMNALQALGDFWGDDQFGETFFRGANGKPGYGAQHDTVTTDTTAIINGYHEIAGLPGSHRGARGLSQMADNIDVANWNTMVNLPKVPE